MPPVFRSEDAARILRWLEDGAEMASAKKGSRARAVDAIWALIEEAILVIDKSPDQEKRWLTSGFRSGGWSNIGLSVSEAKVIERARAMAAMKPGDPIQVSRVALDGAAQDRALDCMSFLRWCGVYVKSTKPDRMRKAAVVLARGGDHDAFSKVWMTDARDVSRAAVSKFRQVLAGHIMAGLREECGIVPCETGCGFKFR